jgi:hypothetical protein
MGRGGEEDDPLRLVDLGARARWKNRHAPMR